MPRRSHLRPALLHEAQDLTPQSLGVVGAVLLQYPVRVPVALAEQPEQQVLAPDLPGTHLPGGGERKLQSPLGARGERVDLLARIAAELLEPRTHAVYVGAGALQGLGRHVLAGHDAREQVVRPDSRRPRGAGRSLAGTHDGLLRLSGERVKQAALPTLLLLYKVLEHRERVGPALRAPDHAELPRTLRANVARRPPVPLLLENLHARRPDPTVLTYHPSKASCIKCPYSLIPHTGIIINDKNLSLSRSYFITRLMADQGNSGPISNGL